MAKGDRYPERSEYRSTNRDGFSQKARDMEKQGFGTRISATGYTDNLVGMDDVDRLRRIKLNHKVNGR